jgi:hypothetical protein
MTEGLAEARERGETERRSQRLPVNPLTTNCEDSRRRAARAFHITRFCESDDGGRIRETHQFREST